MTLDQYILEHLDATDAEILDAVNAPIYTPRPYEITWATVGSVLGPAALVALTMAMEQAKQSVDPVQRATAIAADKVLGGTGFLAADPAAQQIVGQYVEAGIITQQQATDLLNTTSYLTGSIRTPDELATVRFAIAAGMRREEWAAIYNAGVALIDAATGELPSLATLREVQP